jgi:RNA polymerase sigma factor (sigma-70 family)
MLRERPIPEIYGETEWEARVRRLINSEWAGYEADCRRRGWPIVLPKWDGPAALPEYKDPTRECWEYTISYPERRRRHLPQAAPPPAPPAPPVPRTRDERLARDARQKRLARQAKTDRKARNTLMVELLPLVKWQAKRQRGLGVNFEDLVQEGMLGVAAAIVAYKPRAGASFASYATSWSHGRMRRAIANQGRGVRVPEYRVLMAGKVRKARERVQHELGRTPTDHDVAQAMGVPVAEVRRVAVETAPVGSVDALVAEAESGDPPEYTRYLLDPAGNPEALVMRKVVPEGVRRALRTLPYRDRRVLRMRYWDGHTRRSIAEKLGITEKAVRYSEGRALKTLGADENLRYVWKFVWK